MVQKIGQFFWNHMALQFARYLHGLKNVEFDRQTQ